MCWHSLHSTFKVLEQCNISHVLYSAATRNLHEKGQNWVKVSPPYVKYGLSSASAKLVTREVNGLEIRRRGRWLPGRCCCCLLRVVYVILSFCRCLTARVVGRALPSGGAHPSTARAVAVADGVELGRREPATSMTTLNMASEALQIREWPVRAARDHARPGHGCNFAAAPCSLPAAAAARYPRPTTRCSYLS